MEIPFGNPEKVINQVEQATYQFLEMGLKPLMLGGEHSITIGSVKALSEHFPDLIVIQHQAV